MLRLRTRFAERNKVVSFSLAHGSFFWKYSFPVWAIFMRELRALRNWKFSISFPTFSAASSISQQTQLFGGQRWQVVVDRPEYRTLCDGTLLVVEYAQSSVYRS